MDYRLLSFKNKYEFSDSSDYGPIFGRFILEVDAFYQKASLSIWFQSMLREFGWRSRYRFSLGFKYDKNIDSYLKDCILHIESIIDDLNATANINKLTSKLVLKDGGFWSPKSK